MTKQDITTSVCVGGFISDGHLAGLGVKLVFYTEFHIEKKVLDECYLCLNNHVGYLDLMLQRVTPTLGLENTSCVWRDMFSHEQELAYFLLQGLRSNIPQNIMSSLGMFP
jgi:hypothetical protein